MPIENFQEVEDYFKENAENDDVKKFLAGANPINNDRVTDYLNNSEDGKNYLAMHNSEFLANFKTGDEFKNLLEGARAEERKKFNQPDIDPAIKEAQDFIANAKREKAIESVKGEVLKDIPKELHGLGAMLISEDKDISAKNIKNLKNLWDNALKSAVDEKFKTQQEDPKKSEQQEEVTKEAVEAAKQKAEKSGSQADIINYSRLKSILISQGGNK